MTDRIIPIARQLLTWSDSCGYSLAWGPMRVLESVRADLEMQRTTGALDGAFARDNLLFDFPQPSTDTRQWQVLVVAMPRQAHIVSFMIGGRRFEAVLPPTYQRYRPVFEDVRQQLVAEVLSTSSVELVDIPLKAVASRLGLIRYGKNNIAYAASVGSYFQLIGIATDAELPLDPDWREEAPRMLDDCDECAVCEAVCPTDAISSDRILLHAERCLTLANETAGPWPPWVAPPMHHCLVGCLRCQQACPANPELQFEDTGIVFDEDETSNLLAGAGQTGPIRDRIREKLDQLGQRGLEAVLGRNLRALVQAKRRA